MHHWSGGYCILAYEEEMATCTATRVGHDEVAGITMAFQNHIVKVVGDDDILFHGEVST